MLKISSKEIIDVVNYSGDRAIIVEKVRLLDSINKYKVNYFVIDFKSGKKEVITKSAYLHSKFGSNNQKITDIIANFVQCEATILSNKNVLIISPVGEYGLFNSDGELKSSGILEYNGKRVCGLAADGDYFWGYCSDENCVIRYNAENMKVDLRMGGNESSTFIEPVYISSDEENIYVCCDTNKVKQISKSNFDVSGVKGAFYGIKRYYKFNNCSLLCMPDGAYLNTDQ